MATGPREMLIDGFLPAFDATIIEHIVIDASPAAVYEAARAMDFMEIHSPLVDAIMTVRDLPSRVASGLGRGRPSRSQPAMRLADLFDSPEDNVFEGWMGLGEDCGRELVFGAVGKVWKSDIEWKPVAAEAFRDFAEPDYAKIALDSRSGTTARTARS
jgi:hypothetical protein